MTFTTISSPSLQTSVTCFTRFVVELADVHQAVGARQDLDEGAEVDEPLRPTPM